jgi:predicted peroxiredoxin
MEGSSMSTYLFIESRDPFESRDTRFVEETATTLKELGHEVTIFFIQNGVFALRRNACELGLSRMASAGIRLLADHFSLCERGIQQLQPAIESSGIEMLVDLLVEDNTRAIWH